MSTIPELLERFRRAPELVATAITGAAGPELDFAPAPGKWSVRQVLCHLADSEIVAAHRFRLLIAEDKPVLTWYDQDAWARNLDYGRRKISQAMETFRRTRLESHDLLKDLPEAAFARTGTHTKQGEVTLLGMLETYTDHAENHARQIRAVREEYRSKRTVP